MLITRRKRRQGERFIDSNATILASASAAVIAWQPTRQSPSVTAGPVARLHDFADERSRDHR